MFILGMSAALLVGGSLGLFGGGGSILTVPTLHYIFGLEAHAAIDRAVPRNQQLGFDPISLAPNPDRAWAPIEISAAGIPEIAPEWVKAHTGAVTLIDVRELDELVGDLPKIADAGAIPLGQFPGRLADVPRDLPVVLVCRSGGRSAKAALALLDLGFSKVASMRGGMRAWL